jgi:hypothetical protein
MLIVIILIIIIIAAGGAYASGMFSKKKTPITSEGETPITSETSVSATPATPTTTDTPTTPTTPDTSTTPDTPTTPTTPDTPTYTPIPYSPTYTPIPYTPTPPPANIAEWDVYVGAKGVGWSSWPCVGEWANNQKGKLGNDGANTGNPKSMKYFKEFINFTKENKLPANFFTNKCNKGNSMSGNSKLNHMWINPDGRKIYLGEIGKIPNVTGMRKVRMDEVYSKPNLWYTLVDPNAPIKEGFELVSLKQNIHINNCKNRHPNVNKQFEDLCKNKHQTVNNTFENLCETF